MREACKFNVQNHNGNIFVSSVTKDPLYFPNNIFMQDIRGLFIPQKLKRQLGAKDR